MNLIGQLFLKLLTSKDVVNETHKGSCFWKNFDSQRVNEPRKLLKSAEKHFCHTFLSFWAKLSLKKSFSIRSEILGLFFKTLTADDEYSGHNTESLPLPIQMQLSTKRKTFCKKKRMNLIASVFLKLLTPKHIKGPVFEKPLAVNVLKRSSNTGVFLWILRNF